MNRGLGVFISFLSFISIAYSDESEIQKAYTDAYHALRTNPHLTADAGSQAVHLLDKSLMEKTKSARKRKGAGRSTKKFSSSKSEALIKYEAPQRATEEPILNESTIPREIHYERSSPAGAHHTSTDPNQKVEELNF